MLFKSALLTAASGKVGGLVASHNRSGSYFRGLKIPTNPNTVPQQARKLAFGNASVLYPTITAVQKAAWQAYANTAPYKTPLGDTFFLSAQQMFVAANSLLALAGESQISAAPTTTGLTNLGTDIAVALTAATGGSASITWSGTADWTAAGGHLLVFLGSPLSPGKQFFKGPYQLRAKIDGSATPPTSPTAITPITARNSIPLTAGQNIPWRVTAVDAEGRPAQAASGLAVVG